MIEVLSVVTFPRAMTDKRRRRAISGRVMHAKDGQYAPSLFRRMSNDAGLVGLFPVRKVSDPPVQRYACKDERTARFMQCCAMATISDRLRFAALSELRNQILQNCRERQHAERTALLSSLSSELSPLSSSAKGPVRIDSQYHSSAPGRPFLFS
jgi:hypothetical protein